MSTTPPRHPELDALPAMVPDDGAHQRPLTVADVLQGERRSVSRPWTLPGDDAPALRTDEPLPAPPVITTLAELEALAERPLFEDDAEPAEAEPPSPQDDDAPIADFGAPSIHCEPKLPTLTRAELTERITHDLLERLAGLAEHRRHGPLADKAATERRALAQIDALVCLGADAFGRLGAVEPVSPWTTWAVTFALSCLDGQQAAATVHDHVARLAPEQRAHRRRAAEAVAASHHPHALALARAALATPGSEPFGLELLSLLQQLRAEDLTGWLKRPHPETQAVTLRAWTRLEQPPADVREIEALLDTPDPDLAWEAARALTLWSSGAPLRALRHGGTLLSVLGANAIELIVLAGHHDDTPLVQRLVRRLEPSPSLLDAVARLGHPGTWAYLAHFLGDALLADDAVAALRTAFGDRVPDEHRLDVEQWEKAIAQLGLDDTQRVRRGQPWSPSIVAAECADPSLSAHDVTLRLDELRARTRVRLPAALWDLTPNHQTLATDLTAALSRLGALR